VFLVPRKLNNKKTETEEAVPEVVVEAVDAVAFLMEAILVLGTVDTLNNPIHNLPTTVLLTINPTSTPPTNPLLDTTNPPTSINPTTNPATTIPITTHKTILTTTNPTKVTVKTRRVTTPQPITTHKRATPNTDNPTDSKARDSREDREGGLIIHREVTTSREDIQDITYKAEDTIHKEDTMLKEVIIHKAVMDKRTDLNNLLSLPRMADPTLNRTHILHRVIIPSNPQDINKVQETLRRPEAVPLLECNNRHNNNPLDHPQDHNNNIEIMHVLFFMVFFWRRKNPKFVKSLKRTSGEKIRRKVWNFM